MRVVWLAGYQQSASYAWAERAYGLATYANDNGYFGDLPAALDSCHPRAPMPPPWMADGCSVCLEDYTDAWTSWDNNARCPPGRWACTHAVCMQCDLHIEHSPINNTACPLCRAPRN